MSLKDELEALGPKLVKMVDNLATLTVTTRTTDAGGKPTERAKTVIKPDGDTTVDIPTTDGSTIATDLLGIHNDTVRAAIEARAKTIQAVVDAIKAIMR